jgi:PAS domain S-box-containing protein
MSPRPDIGYHPARILIVDDERHNRELLAVMLAPEGYLLLSAASGEEALAMAAQQTPALILLDIMMPGMDGYQVATRIKGNLATNDIPIIMVTALDDRNAKMLGLSAGAEEFLTKPVDRAELCVRVRNLLRLKAYADYLDKYSLMLEGEVASRTTDLIERTKQAAVLTEQAALLDLAQDAIVVRDMNSRILFWSRGAEVMYGWASSEAVGRNTVDLLTTEVADPIETIHDALLREGQWDGEAIHHKRDGTRLSVATRWALQRNAEGQPTRVLTITNDITGRMRADSERRLLTQRLSLATAVAKVGVWEWDLASDTLTWDATMFHIYGLPPQVPMPYATWAAAVLPEDLAAAETTLQTAISFKGQAASEYRIVLPDGSLRNVSAVGRVVLDEHGNVSRLIGVDMDVTERREAAEALEQSRQDQMRFKDEFLSHVSHELRSPLTAIKQFTSILLGGVAGELNPEQREYQQIVLKNIQQLQSMIDDLLEVTRLETGKLTVEPERVSLANAVTDAFNTLRGTASAKGITLSCALPHDIPSAHADQTRLRQILIILLDNAIKFTPEGGAVSVRGGLLPEDPRILRVDVSDSGCGISVELADKLFERLYQVADPVHASRKGLGLGLYICKALVTRQGGHIWVEPRSPKGSTFSFTLPVFSLDNVIAPLLKNDRWPAESVALVKVEVCAPAPWSSRAAQEEWSREARSLLARCTLPDLDVLLPNMSSEGEGERFFVAAFASERGAAVLAKRIRKQFEHLPRMKQAGMTLVVSYSMLERLPRDVGASTASIVTRMASSLEEEIASHKETRRLPS